MVGRHVLRNNEEFLRKSFACLNADCGGREGALIQKELGVIGTHRLRGAVEWELTDVIEVQQ
jgi:hypothetical protein